MIYRLVLLAAAFSIAVHALAQEQVAGGRRSPWDRAVK